MTQKKFSSVLFLYHLVFILLAYQYAKKFGSDANLYWLNSSYTTDKSWLDFAHYGTDTILFLNYPLVKMGLPFWFGFLVYGTIGFLGILKWIEWAEIVTENRLRYGKINAVWCVALLPNLHFWTASLGKEALIFWGLANVFYGIATKKFFTLATIMGILLVVIIRPHVAFMLLVAVGMVFIFDKRIAFKRRAKYGFLLLIGTLGLVYMMLQLSGIKIWNWSRINYFNEYSILSFKNSGSYVPMLEYNYGYKFFSFNFRPLFFDTASILGFGASLENAVFLMTVIIALYYAIKYYKKIQWPQRCKIALVFSIITSMIYIERYANLGIFMRTKMMYQPFLWIVLLFIISQAIAISKQKTDAET